MVDIIKNIEFMPDLLSPIDLVKIGLFGSRNAACMARVNGKSPDWIKVGGRIRYPKTSVIDFIKENLKDGSQKKGIYRQ